MELSLAFIACKLGEAYSVSLLDPEGAAIDLSSCRFVRGLPTFSGVRLWRESLASPLPGGIIPVVDASVAGEGGFTVAHPASQATENALVWVGTAAPPTGAYCVWVHGGANGENDAGGAGGANGAGGAESGPNTRQRFASPCDQKAVFLALLDVFDRFSAWSDAVRMALLNHEPISQVVRMLDDVTENPYWLADSAMRAVVMSPDTTMTEISAKWRQQRETGRYSADVIASIVANGDMERMSQPAPAWLFDDSPNYNLPFVVKTVHSNEGIRFYLFIIQLRQGPCLCDLELAEELGNLVGRYLQHGMADATDDQHFAGNVLRTCLDGAELTADALHDVQSFFGWTDDDEFVVALFDRGEAVNGAAEAPKVQIELLRDCLDAGVVFAYGVRIVYVTVVSGGSAQDVEKRVETTCEGLDWKAGMSNVFSDLADFARYYLQARIALDSGMRLAPQTALHCFAHYCLDYLCHRISALDSDGLLMHPDLELLASYDRASRSQLTETLVAYLENECNVSRAAKALGLHRNSVVYRLERIEGIIRTSLDDADNRLALRMSLKLASAKRDAQVTTGESHGMRGRAGR